MVWFLELLAYAGLGLLLWALHRVLRRHVSARAAGVLAGGAALLIAGIALTGVDWADLSANAGTYLMRIGIVAAVLAAAAAYGRLVLLARRRAAERDENG